MPPGSDRSAPGGAAPRDEIAGGLTALLFTLPIILSTGAVVFLPLGGDFVAAGVAAAFATAIVGALVPAVLGGGRLHVNAPRATQAALLAALMLQAAAVPGMVAVDPAMRPYAAMAVAAAALAVAGLAQIVLGLARLGDLVRFVPQAIVAGFVNGFVLQIVLLQLPFLVGLGSLSDLGAALAGRLPIGLAPPVFAALAGAAVLALPRVVPWLPAALGGLAVGTLVQHGVALLAPAAGLGPLIGGLPTGLPFMPPAAAARAVVDAGLVASLAGPVVVTGVTLAVVTSIQSLLSAAVADSLQQSRGNGNHELVVQGVGNLVSATVGGTACGGSPLLTRAALAQGARGRGANLTLGLGLIAVGWGLGDAVGAIPLSVMAAVVTVTTAQGVDGWTIRLIRTVIRSRDRAVRAAAAGDLAVVALVGGLVAAGQVLPALVAGLLATIALFLRRAAGRVVRRVHRFRPDTGEGIAVVELQGPLFFASAEPLATRVTAVAASVRTVVLDFRRVTDVDSTGALLLKRLDRELADSGRHLLLAGLPPGAAIRRLLREGGFDDAEREGRVYARVGPAVATAAA